VQVEGELEDVEESRSSVEIGEILKAGDGKAKGRIRFRCEGSGMVSRPRGWVGERRGEPTKEEREEGRRRGGSVELTILPHEFVPDPGYKTQRKRHHAKERSLWILGGAFETS